MRHQVTIREPGQITELETVLADNMYAAIEKVKQQLIVEKRKVERVTFSAVRLDDK